MWFTILAQNLQQPLNGNKHIALIVSFLLLFTACVTPRPLPIPSKSDPIVVQHPPARDTVLPPPVIDVIVDKDKDSVISVPVDEKDIVIPIKKGSYNVVLLLPFSKDESRFLPLLGTTDKVSLRGLLASEYYSGVQMGLDTLRMLGANINLSVFDSRKDPAKVKELLLKPELQNADAIIGPIYNQALQVIATFAKENNISVFSPLSTASRLADRNPYYHILSPSAHAKARAIFQVMDSLESNAHFVHIKNRKSRRKSGDLFQIVFDAQNYGAKGHSFSSISSDDATYEPDDIQGAMVMGRKNIFIIDSEEQSFISQMITNVKSALRTTKQDGILFGSASWVNKDQIALDALETLKFHCVSTYYVDFKRRKTQDFVQRYTLKYNAAPTGISFKGYDHILFVGANLHQFGSGNDHHYDNSFPFAKSLFNPIQMSPVLGLDEETGLSFTKYHENFKVSVARYEGGNLLPLN